jgi:hypothetical protein
MNLAYVILHAQVRPGKLTIRATRDVNGHLVVPQVLAQTYVLAESY